LIVAVCDWDKATAQQKSIVQLMISCLYAVKQTKAMGSFLDFSFMVYNLFWYRQGYTLYIMK